jgi:GxxExxY protein
VHRNHTEHGDTEQFFKGRGVEKIAEFATLARWVPGSGLKKDGSHVALSGAMIHDHTITDRIIGAAIEVHRRLGPGLLEAPYRRALCIELLHQGMRVETNRRIPMEYRGELIGEYIPDLIVENTVVVEVKSVSHIEPVFTAQVLTYLRLTGLHVGLILNFNVPKLVNA